jgi:hypothetical protein
MASRRLPEAGPTFLLLVFAIAFGAMVFASICSFSGQQNHYTTPTIGS